MCGWFRLRWIATFLSLDKKFHDVKGFDIDKKRIFELKKGLDVNKEISKKDLKIRNKNNFTNKLSDIKKGNLYIFTLPTPIDKNKNPDLKILKKATIQISKLLKHGDTVVYESTVYPGLTEEVLVPIIEKYSKMKLNIGFFVDILPKE